MGKREKVHPRTTGPLMSLNPLHRTRTVANGDTGRDGAVKDKVDDRSTTVDTPEIDDRPTLVGGRPVRDTDPTATRPVATTDTAGRPVLDRDITDRSTDRPA